MFFSKVGEKALRDELIEMHRVHFSKKSGKNPCHIRTRIEYFSRFWIFLFSRILYFYILYFYFFIS